MDRLGHREQEADPVVSQVKPEGIVLILLLLIMVAGAGARALSELRPPKPREYPLWCHNAYDIAHSGVCSKVQVKPWST